jgi:hypothetical protein
MTRYASGRKKNPDFEKKPSLYSRTGDEAEVSSILIHDPPADTNVFLFLF